MIGYRENSLYFKTANTIIPKHRCFSRIVISNTIHAIENYIEDGLRIAFGKMGFSSWLNYPIVASTFSIYTNRKVKVIGISMLGCMTTCASHFFSSGKNGIPE